MGKITASVILPTFNESGNIIELIETLLKELSKKRISSEIIVVDDNSQDKTGVLCQKYFSKTPNVRALIRRDRGLATAVRYGIEKAVGEIIVVMDTDFNHDPRLVPKLIEKCKKYDFVVGSRYIKGGGMANKSREKLSFFFNLVVRLILASPVRDNLSGFFAIRTKMLEKLNFDRIFYGYGDYFIRLIYYSKIQGSTFSELPAFYNDRMYGVSKSQFIQMFRDYLASTLSLRFKN